MHWRHTDRESYSNIRLSKTRWSNWSKHPVLLITAQGKNCLLGWPIYIGFECNNVSSQDLGRSELSTSHKMHIGRINTYFKHSSFTRRRRKIAAKCWRRRRMKMVSTFSAKKIDIINSWEQIFIIQSTVHISAPVPSDIVQVQLHCWARGSALRASCGSPGQSYVWWEREEGHARCSVMFATPRQVLSLPLPLYTPAGALQSARKQTKFETQRATSLLP